MKKYKTFDRPTTYGAFTVHIIVLGIFVYQSRIQCAVPLDLKPITTYDIDDTTSYAVFSGICGNSENTLQDIQGVKKINETYYVYARDYIYVVVSSIQSNGTRELVCSQTIYLPSPDNTVSLCKRKGQSIKNCHNYIKLFEQIKTDRDVMTNKVLVCGTNSFDPTCLFYMIQKDGHLKALNERAMPGNLACPFDPNDSLASVMSGGNLYTATQSNFGGHDALIYRSSMSSTNDKNLRTIKGDTTMLNDPDFIQLVDGGLINKMFVFFTETAIEDNSNQIYSRIGQMCKNDQGGEIVLRNQFSSFFKARLNCSLPGHPPFYFNELRGVSELVTLQLGDGPKENVMFTIMNTPRNSIPASAICVFTAKDIQNALTGPFTEKQSVHNSQFTYWDKLNNYPKPHLAECGSVGGKRNLNKTQLNFVRKHPMMYDSILSWNFLDDINDPLRNSHPIFTRTSARNFLTSIAVDTMAGFVELYTVVLVGTEDGKVIKIVILKNKSVSVVEERVIFNEPKCGSVDKSVRSITINRENGTMFVTFGDCFVSAPLCPLVGVCARSCIASRDPYCVSDGISCLSSHQHSNGNSTTTQVFNSVDTGNIDWLPPCPKSDNPDGATDSEMTSTDETPFTTTKTKNETVKVVPTPTKIGAVLTEGWILPVVIPSMFVAGLIAGLCICMLAKKDRSCIRKNINTKKISANGKLPNVAYDNRRDSSSKKSTSSRHESPNSKAKRDEMSRRSRKITETSVHNKSDEEQEVFSDTPDSPNKRMSDTFRKKHFSVSSQGGRRRTRNSKPSTSSGPEADDALLSNSQKSQYQIDDQNMRGSSDSGHSSEGLIIPPENIYSQSVPPTTMPNQRTRGPPMRSASFAGHQHIPRSHTMDNYTRNGRRPPMDRQFSLQQAARPMYATNPPSRYQQPHPSNGPPWPHTAQPVVQVTPKNKQYGGPSNRMTASLDRRMMKNKGHFQAVPGDVFNDEPIISNNNGYQQSQRKRYASESTGIQIPQQLIPSQYQPMRDEQKLLPINEEQHLVDDHQLIDKNRLRLNIPMAVEQDNRISSSSAPVKFSRSQIIDGIPLMFPRGPFLRQNPSVSNPGTPVREMPPDFIEIVNVNKGHATLPTNPKTHQRFQPNSLNFNKRLSNHQSGDTSPSKSTPSSPMNNSHFRFPNQEKMRHNSGQMNAVTPTSGENKPILNPQTPSNQRTRHSSGPTRSHSGQAAPNDITMNSFNASNGAIVT